MIFFLLLNLAQAQVLPLPKVNAPMLLKLPIVRDSQPPIPCNEIYARLVKYNEMARQSDQSITQFLLEVGAKATSWHEQLGPLEGKTETIPAGTFFALKDSGDKITQVTNLAFDNTELLALELDRIIAAASTCLPTLPNRKFANQ